MPQKRARYGFKRVFMDKSTQDSANIGKPLFVLWHLGAGDAILCNGLIRALADRQEKIIVPAYPHNVEAVTFMFRDNPRIEVVECQNSTHAAAMAVACGNFLPLGYYSKHKFDPRYFDKEFYSQANVDFKERWDKFFIPFELKDLPIVPSSAFVHHDVARNFQISMDHWPRDRIFVIADKSKPFFDWIDTIQISEEIHVINSSFLILIDSLPDIEGQKLYFHRYPRPTDHPVLRKQWNILQ